jgi:Fic family protein
MEETAASDDADDAEIVMCIWEQSDWPNPAWQYARIAGPLAAVRHDQGRSIGRMAAPGFKLREEAVLQSLTQDVVKTREIEGDLLDARLSKGRLLLEVKQR